MLRGVDADSDYRFFNAKNNNGENKILPIVCKQIVYVDCIDPVVLGKFIRTQIKTIIGFDDDIIADTIKNVLFEYSGDIENNGINCKKLFALLCGFMTHAQALHFVQVLWELLLDNQSGKRLGLMSTKKELNLDNRKVHEINKEYHSNQDFSRLSVDVYPLKRPLTNHYSYHIENSSYEKRNKRDYNETAISRNTRCSRCSWSSGFSNDNNERCRCNNPQRFKRETRRSSSSFQRQKSYHMLGRSGENARSRSFSCGSEETFDCKCEHSYLTQNNTTRRKSSTCKRGRKYSYSSSDSGYSVCSRSEPYRRIAYKRSLGKK